MLEKCMIAPPGHEACPLSYLPDNSLELSTGKSFCIVLFISILAEIFI